MLITEVAEKYGLTNDTLRYYERIGLLPHIARTKSGVRDYSEKDCNWVAFIKCMRSAGLSIDVLTQYVRLCSQGEKTKTARKALLISQRDLLVKRILDMEDTLKKLDYKIKNYDHINP